MHQINLSENIVDPPLAPGSYIGSNAASAEILAYNPVACQLATPAFFQKEFTPDRDWNGKKILVTLQGAAGDILMVTPCLREVKKRWPDCSIDFACFPRFACLLKHNPYVSATINHPIEVEQFNSYDAVVWLDDNFAEEKEFGKTVPAIDRFLRRFHLDVGDAEKEIVYNVTQEEQDWALEEFPLKDRQRIGIQMSASEPARTWPKENLREFSVLAIKKGYEVVWIGFPGETGAGKTPPPEHLIDLTRHDPPLTIREALAVLSTCHGVVAPDSLCIHAAGALHLPTIGLFAAFPSQLRTSYAPTIHAINGRVGCDISPCFHYAGRPGVFQFPEEGPCAKVGYCTSMKEISPDRVLSLLEKKMEKPK